MLALRASPGQQGHLADTFAAHDFADRRRLAARASHRGAQAAADDQIQFVARIALAEQDVAGQEMPPRKLGQQDIDHELALAAEHAFENGDQQAALMGCSVLFGGVRHCVSGRWMGALCRT